MLVNQSSFLTCSPIKFSPIQYGKTNLIIPLFHNYHLTKKTSRVCHVDLKCSMVKSCDDAKHMHARIGGLGILEFFEGKNIFVIGATGFLGKVVVEKLLRSTAVGKMYILIKAQDEEAAFRRFTQEIINSELFECLKRERGNDYEDFIMEKLIPIVGNICEPNLGMDSNSAEAVRRDVDVIIQSAGCTTFNERYDILFDENVNAPQRLMQFAKTCNNLELFSHFSTAYVNGREKGLILEKPLNMGEMNGARNENAYPELDIANEMNIISKSSSTASSSSHYETTKMLKKLGQDRAKMFGWNNGYQLTKAMGEMVMMEEERGDIPLLILRPTVVGSTYQHPFPGWIQGKCRMFDPLIVSYGKGHLPAYLGNPLEVLDMIPVDMVANAAIAAMAKHGNIHKPQVNVYHVGSSVTNPLRFCDIFEYLHEYFNENPLVSEGQDISRLEFFNNFKELSKYTRDQLWLRINNNVRDSNEDIINRRIKNEYNAKVAYAEQLCKMYEFVGFYNARFDSGNTQKLKEEMSKEEQLEFEVDARNVEWKKYFMEIHVPALRKYIINSPMTN